MKTYPSRLIATAVLLCGLLVSVSAGFAQTGDRVGKGPYKAASGKYSLPTPVDRDNGGKVQTSPVSLGFTDDVGSLFRIEEMALPLGMFEGDPARKAAFLDSFLANLYLPQTIWKIYPESKPSPVEELPELHDGGRYAEIFIPKGSIIVHSVDGKKYDHFDTLRGIVFFVRGNDLFVVSVALPQLRPLPEDRIKFSADLRAETLKFLSTLKFNPTSAKTGPKK